MKKAEIEGICATSKGIRHGFGVLCVRTGVPLNYIQKWMGHSTLEATRVYFSALEQNERSFAEKLWN